MNTHTELAAALAKANLELTNPHKDARAETGQYGYSYATLDAITQAIRPVLAKHGLSVMQDVRIDGGQLSVSTTLLHSSGQSITFGPLTGPTGSSWQQVGSGISYARRYQLLSCLGLAAGDDDDAQALERPQVNEAPVNVGSARGPLANHKAGAIATDAQRKKIAVLAKIAGYPGPKEFLASEQAEAYLGGGVSSPLKKGHASTLIDRLEADLATTTPVAFPPDVEPDEALLGEEYEAGR